jgi:hypothetical protein
VDELPHLSIDFQYIIESSSDLLYQWYNKSIHHSKMFFPSKNVFSNLSHVSSRVGTSLLVSTCAPSPVVISLVRFSPDSAYDPDPPLSSQRKSLIVEHVLEYGVQGIKGFLSGESTYTRCIEKFLAEKCSACVGGAYPFAVTTKRIRLHLDTVQKAFCV